MPVKSWMRFQLMKQELGHWQRQYALLASSSGEAERAERCWTALCMKEPQDPALWLQWSNALSERQMMQQPIRVLKNGDSMGSP